MRRAKIVLILISNIFFLSPSNSQNYYSSDTIIVDRLILDALNYSDELKLDSAIINYEQALNIIIEIQGEKNQRVVDMVVGALVGSYLTVVNYSFSSSAGSDKKTDIIAKSPPVIEDKTKE